MGKQNDNINKKSKVPSNRTNNTSERFIIASAVAFYLSTVGLQGLNVAKVFLKTESLSEGFIGLFMCSRYPKGIMIATSALLIILGLSYIMMNLVAFCAKPNERKNSLVASLVLGTTTCLVPAGLIINDLISHSDKSLMLMNYGLLAAPAILAIALLGLVLYFMSLGLNKFFDNFTKYNKDLSDGANKGGIKGPAYTLLKLPFYLLTAVLGVLSVPVIAVEFCIKLVKAVVDLTIYICKGIASLVSGKGDEAKKKANEAKKEKSSAQGVNVTNNNDLPKYSEINGFPIVSSVESSSDKSLSDELPSYNEDIRGYIIKNFTPSNLLTSSQKTIKGAGKSLKPA